MEQLVLAINPGSSSREYALYKGEHRLAESYYELSAGVCRVSGFTGSQTFSDQLVDQRLESTLAHFVQHCELADMAQIKHVGIRLVAPGRRFLRHLPLDDELQSYLHQIVDKAPLHLTPVLREVESARQSFPQAALWAISDSAFHSTLRHEARCYAIPRDDAERFDVYRYGYHGISLSSVVGQLRAEGHEYLRVVVCHLGSGSSATALHDWQSVDTSMGYSPLEGLVMSSRSGSIDVEAALELKRQLSLDDSGLVKYLNRRCGLLGLSRSSGDIRLLLEQEVAGNSDAAFALSSMVYRLVSQIGAYYAILGGLDALVFTATVGERSAVMRQRICEGLVHLGISIDELINRQTYAQKAIISHQESPIKVHVVPTNETSEIARLTLELAG